MSNLIVLPFLALLITAVVLLWSAKSKSRLPKHIKRRLWGCILFGVSFFYFGITSFVGVRLSDRPEVTGVLTNFSRSLGSRHKSSNFQITYRDQRTPVLACTYIGNALGEGEVVFARYLAFDHSVLYLRVLDGPHAGFIFSQPAEQWSDALMLLIGIGGFYCGYRELRKLRSSSHLQSS